MKGDLCLNTVIDQYGQILLEAMGQTLLLALYGLLFACILGLIFGMLSVVKNKVCNVIAYIFVYAIRGVPMIVLAFFIFFGVPYLFNTIFEGLFAEKITLTALQAGTACLALNCGAYMSEIIRAGIQSVDRGQMEAARSLGMTYWRSMRKVVLPQAIRTMIPSIINQFIITTPFFLIKRRVRHNVICFEVLVLVVSECVRCHFSKVCSDAANSQIHFAQLVRRVCIFLTVDRNLLLIAVMCLYELH